jgi:Na+/citrate or Na+/malate symporter
MRTTTISSTSVKEHAGAVGRGALARCMVQLIGTFALNAVLLLVGARVTGIAWQDLCLLLLPPMVASAGAGLALPLAHAYVALTAEQA